MLTFLQQLHFGTDAFHLLPGKRLPTFWCRDARQKIAMKSIRDTNVSMAQVNFKPYEVKSKNVHADNISIK